MVCRDTLESGHVKILSRHRRPKTVCQTATGNMVVGSDTHVVVEVNFVTTTPAKKGHHREDVLSAYACSCRLEAVVSDQIKRNLRNVNALCWKGWMPVLRENMLTVQQQGVTLLPTLYGDCAWLESVPEKHPSAKLAVELISLSAFSDLNFSAFRDFEVAEQHVDSSCDSTDMSVGQSVRMPVGQSVRMPVGQSVRLPVGQSVRMPAGQSSVSVDNTASRHQGQTGPGPRAPAPASSSGNTVGVELGSFPACVGQSVGRLVGCSGDDRYMFSVHVCFVVEPTRTHSTLPSVAVI